jgi:hypothetical protein
MGLLCCAAARAEPRDAALEYGRGVGAETCPDEVVLRAAVERRLGRDPFRPTAPLRVSVTVEKTGDDLAGTIRVLDGVNVYERRVASAGRCEDLIPALAIGVSLAIDPLADPAETTAEPAKTPPAPKPPSPSTAQPATRPPRAERRAPPHAVWMLEAGPQVSAGLVPHLGAGLEIDLDSRRGWWSGAVGCRGVLPTAPARGVRGSVRAELAAAGGRVCVHSGPMAACGLGLAGALFGQGSGVERPAHAVAPFAAAGLGLRLSVLRGPLTLATSLDALGVFRHTDLMLDDRPVWSTPVVAFAVGTSLGFEL